MADALRVAARYDFNIAGLAKLEQTLKLLEGIAEASDRVTGATRGVAAAFESISSSANAASGRGVAGLNRIAIAADRTAAALRRVRDTNPVPGGGGGSRGNAGSKVLEGAGTVAGVASAITLVSGVRANAENQAQISRIAAMTGRKPADIGKTYMPVALAAANRTGIPVSETLGVVAQVAGIIKNPKELLASVVGQKGSGGIIDLVSVLKRNGAQGSAADIAREVTTADHILNAYTGPAMAKVNDKLFRFVISSHANLSQIVTQMGYYGEQYRLAGGSRPTAINDILQAAQLGVAGIGHGKWGSGFGQILRTASHPSKAQRGALEKLGILDSSGRVSSTTQDRQGQFTPFAMFAEAARRTAGMTPMARQVLINSLPANAARVFAEALSPKTSAFLARSSAAQAALPSLMQTEAGQMQQLNAKTDRLKENFKQLSAVVAGPLMGPLSRFVGGAANKMNDARAYLSGHPMAQTAASAAAVAGSALVSGKLLDFVGIHGPSKAMEAVGRGLMSPAVRRTAWDVVSMRGTRNAVGGALERVGSAALNSSRFGPVLGRALDVVSHLGSAFARVLPVMGNVGGIVARLGGVFGRIGTKTIPVVGEILLLGDIIRTLGAHSKNIGEIIGHVAAWLVKTGGPMMFSAVTSIWNAVVKDTLDILGTLLRGIIDTVKGLFNGGHGGFFDFFHSVVDNAVRTYEADTARTDHPNVKSRVQQNTTVSNVYHMHGEAARREVRKAIDGGRMANARVSGAAVSHLLPPAQTIGLGYGH